MNSILLLAIIGVSAVVVIAGIVTYQFIKPIYDEYQINQQIEYKKQHSTDPKLVEGLNKYINEGNK